MIAAYLATSVSKGRAALAFSGSEGGFLNNRNPEVPERTMTRRVVFIASAWVSLARTGVAPAHSKPLGTSLIGSLGRSNSVRRYPHSGDRALASKSAAAFAASNVSAVPSATRSSRLLLPNLGLQG
jgi:hypothetical protein